MSQESARNILIVDDEPYVCEVLFRWLTAAGYRCTIASDGKWALEYLEREKFHLVLCDIKMPGMSGLDLLNIVRTKFRDVAVVMVTAVDDRKTGITALELGAYGYVIKPFERNEILINVASALERRDMALVSQEYERNLAEHAKRRIAAVRQREEKTVARLMAAMAARTGESEMHIRRVGLYASSLANSLGWTAQNAYDIQIAAMMHDIGKIAVPSEILLKSDKLTPEEYEIVKTHSEAGAEILHGTQIEMLDMAKEIALYHHEKWDGSGYPRAMPGDAIPESARITAIVEVYDALMSRRPYREAFSEDEALNLLRSEKGKQFDPQILEWFFRLVPELRRIKQETEVIKIQRIHSVS
jgi:putative two-component system response regulator